MAYKLTPTPVDGETGKFIYPGAAGWASWNGPFGGALLGSVIEGMEQMAGQPLVAATAQFLKLAKQGPQIVLHSEVLAQGRAVTQARSQAFQDGALLFTAAGTFAAGPARLDPRSVGTMPAVRPPDQSPPRSWMRPLKGGLNDTVDVRDAAVESSHVYLWARCPPAAGSPMTASLLSVFADHPPYGVTLLLGGEWFGMTLDGTLRVVSPLGHLDGASFVLLDMAFDALGEQFGFATVNMWSADGVLLAIATQSLRLRNGITGNR